MKTNLQAGRLRLVFVADELPPELRRVVEFLNSQMDPTAVFAVEIRQYLGAGLPTVLTTLIGQTAEAQGRKGTTVQTPRTWNASSFRAELEAKTGPAQTTICDRLLAWAAQHRVVVMYGRGRTLGSFSLVYELSDAAYQLC